MAFAHSKSSRLLLDDIHLSVFLKSWEHTTEREMANVTVHTDDGHKFIPGLDNGSLSLGGVVDDDATADGQDETLDTALGASSGSVVTAAPAGLAVGNRVISIEARESQYSISSPVADAVSFSASWMAEGQVDTGVSLHDLTAESATADGASVDNGASSANGGLAALHVTANTRDGSSTIKVQHSSDDVTFVDLVTFSAVAASTTTQERKVVTGTVNQFLRASWTPGGTTGSITFVVSFARR